MSSTLPIDVIILANCQTDQLYEMTLEAIESFGDVNIIWIEGNRKIKDNRITAYQHKPFNFNQCIRQAMEYLKPENDAVFMVNNDVLAYPDCLNILHQRLSKWDSVSPMCPLRHKGFTGEKEGYLRAHELAGWAIMFHKRIFEKCTPKQMFPLELKFWRQDQYYADVIKIHGFTHALIGDAKLIHYENMTHDYLPNKEEYTKGMFKVYEKIKKYDRRDI